MALHPKKARKLWVWIAVSRLTRRILASHRWVLKAQKTLKRLWARLSHLKPFAIATDRWKVYRKIIPASLLIQSKALTTNIESVNAQVRNYLARFNRKTKRYSKSPLMAELALYTLWKQKLC